MRKNVSGNNSRLMESRVSVGSDDEELGLGGFPTIDLQAYQDDRNDSQILDSSMMIAPPVELTYGRTPQIDSKFKTKMSVEKVKEKLNTKSTMRL